MKKKKWFLVLLVLILIGGVSLFTFNQNAKERKEQQIIKMETITAKQIKNTFANVTKIEFDEEYGENKLTGYTEVMVTVSTSYGVSSEIGVSMSPKDNIDESYLGSGELPVLKKGLTETKVIVIFSNKEERSF
ncbi:hypothetical protein [Candidatus Enterococcus lemimoniae]|uniref:DUF5067 domain-containing protein n=1 Tax=Candidatus Enterococcus lemimoniae TaxID=1834167 RepID=A0ABZ2T634_9ENTE|nr:hypothetical protein [Enterococcus sp. 12C11_DIV0727]OTO67923.1 hypothetical protein A5866_000118 [Enterococcus sp. 12C11_DIV0727]